MIPRYEYYAVCQVWKLFTEKKYCWTSEVTRLVYEFISKLCLTV